MSDSVNVFVQEDCIHIIEAPYIEVNYIYIPNDLQLLFEQIKEVSTERRNNTSNNSNKKQQTLI